MLPFTDGLGGVNGRGPQSCPRGGVVEGGQGVIFVGVPGGVGVGDVGWQGAGGQDPYVGGGVVNMAREFHFFHHFRVVEVGVVMSLVVAVVSMVMVHVPSGSVTRAVMGRPRWVAQEASSWRVRVRASLMLVAVRVRVMPAMVTVVAASVLMCAVAGGQVCTGLSFRRCSGWDVQAVVHILCESKEGR